MYEYRFFTRRFRHKIITTKTLEPRRINIGRKKRYKKDFLRITLDFTKPNEKLLFGFVYNGRRKMFDSNNSMVHW